MDEAHATQNLPDALRRALHEQITGRDEDDHTPQAPADLMRDALTMSVNKNLLDVLTLLQWAHDARYPEEKLRHVRQATAMMTDVQGQLEDLEQNGRRGRF